MEKAMIPRENYKAYLALACVCIVWGTTYLGLRVGVAEFPPFLFSGIRQIIAGVCMVSFFLAKGEKFPRGRELKMLVLSGIMMITFGNGVVSWAEKYVTSGIAALICSLVPIWIIVINLLFFRKEKLNIAIIAGILLGFLGIALIFSGNFKDFVNPNYIGGIVVIFLSTISWAAGTMITKNSKITVNFLLAAGIQILSGGFGLMIMSVLFDDWTEAKIVPESIMALVYMILIGTLLAYSAYHYALGKLPATLVSIYAYVNPVIAILLGWFVLDEKLDSIIGIALLVTISGIYLVNKGFNTQTYVKQNS